MPDSNVSPGGDAHAGGAVQALHRATRIAPAVAPYDTAHVTVHYPALSGERIDPVGTLAPDIADGQQLPIVVFAPGMNCEPAYYRWLAVALAQAGFAAVTYTLVAEVPPAQFGITPGVDTEAVTPETYGTRPVGRAFGAIMELMATLNAEGPLAGALDLDHVALGGHSAGGTVALESASAAYFPQVKAAFSYASHTMASTVFGWPAGTVLPLSGGCAFLMIDASLDGLVASAAKWYGDDNGPFDPIGWSFDTLRTDRGAADSWLVTLEGANHFAVCAPEDHRWPRDGEDIEPTLSGDEVRKFLAAAIPVFLRCHLMDDGDAADEFKNLVSETPFVSARTR